MSRVKRLVAIPVLALLVSNLTAAPAAPAAGRPDLVTGSIGFAPDTVQVGATFSATDSVKNIGKVKAGASTTRYYLSADGKKGAGDLRLTGSRAVPKLAPHKVSKGSVKVTIPSSTGLGNYYLLACADDLHKVTETKESNNCRASSSTLLVELPPTSEDLINAALRSGTIDYPTSLLDRVYALYGDARLPSQYVGGGSMGDDSEVFDEAQRASSELPPTVKAALQPYLVRPTDPSSVFSNPAALPPAARPSAARAGGGTGPPHPVACTDGWDATVSNSDFRVWVCKNGSYLADAKQALSIAESKWSDETGLMGQPLFDTGGPDAGGDSNIDLYLVDATNQYPDRTLCLKYLPKYPDLCILGSSALALTFSAPPENDPSQTGDKASGFIILSRQALDRSIPDFTSDFVHEFFHLLQNAHNWRIQSIYLGKDKGSDTNWFVEASAKWAEWRFAPATSARKVHNWFTDVFAQSEENRLSLQASRLQDPRHLYGAYIWPFFMQQEAGDAGDSIAAAWKAIESKHDWSGITDAIDQQLPFQDHFRDFAVRNLNMDLPGKPLGKLYQDLDANFPEASQKPALKIGTTNISDTKDITMNTAIPSLAAHYDHFTFGSKVHAVSFDFTGLDPQSALDVDALVKIKGKDWVRMKAEDKPLKFCLDEPAQNVQDMYLILSNHDKANATNVTGHYVVKPRDHCLTRLAGTVSVQYSDSRSGNTPFGPWTHKEQGSGTLHLAFEPAPPKSGVQYWDDAGGSWSASRTYHYHSPVTSRCDDTVDYTSSGNGDLVGSSLGINYDTNTANLFLSSSNGFEGQYTKTETISGCGPPTDGTYTDTGTTGLSGVFSDPGPNCHDDGKLVDNGTKVDMDCSDTYTYPDGETVTFQRSGSLIITKVAPP